MTRLKIRLGLTAFLLLGIGLCFLQSCGTGPGRHTSFAIVVDSLTHAHTAEAIEAYRSMLEKEGLKTHLLSANWERPEEIREKLISLYQKRPILEGAVFIGDIPIPMIRDAQHLTSAFKMDQQRFPYQRSSVPSDRYYDDFDLVFDYLGPDEERPLYHYYSLRAESAQKISTNIYSGRIKPPRNGQDPYEQINRYLEKVVAARREVNTLDHVLTYAGHGYNSECLVAWGSERIAYREQLPLLFEPGASYTYLYTHMRDFSKQQILSELQRPELDMAILSNHGGATAQYLDGWPNVSQIGPSIENVQRFLRSRLRNTDRRGGDIQATMRDFMERHDVPGSWFDGAFDPAVMEADSLFSAKLDIYIPDVEGITPHARFIKFDACFNGSFHLDEYIAGSYVFAEGQTLVGMANSVNVLQDNWPIELIGLLGKGVRIGNWARHIHYLENHIIGDPTFYFHADVKTNWNHKIVRDKHNIQFWKSQLNHPHPDIQSLALSMLYSNRYPYLSELLMDAFLSSQYGAVRMQSLALLHEINDANYTRALKKSVHDPYELVRRLGARQMGMVGSDELVPALISAHFQDAHSRRVLFNSRNSAAFFPRDLLKEEISRQYEVSYLVHKEELWPWISGMAHGRILAEREIILDASRETRQRLGEIRTLRNYTYHFDVPAYVELAADMSEQPEIRLALIEALGWFTHSVNRQLILDMCREVQSREDEEENIRQEALKTLNRLLAYQYNP